MVNRIFANSNSFFENNFLREKEIEGIITH